MSIFLNSYERFHKLRWLEIFTIDPRVFFALAIKGEWRNDPWILSIPNVSVPSNMSKSFDNTKESSVIAPSMSLFFLDSLKRKKMVREKNGGERDGVSTMTHW